MYEYCLNVSSTYSKQSELCVDRSRSIDTRLLCKAAICNYCAQYVDDKIIKALRLKPKVSVCGARENNTLFASYIDVAYVCRAFPDIIVSDNGSRNYGKVL